MAFERIEPSGSLHLEAVIGTLCCVIANRHRDPKHEPLTPSHFMPNLARALRAGPEAVPILLDDPDAQSALMMQALFGRIDG